MKVILLSDARIRHYAGETVEVTPEERDFLVSTGTAVAIEADGEKPKRTKKK